MEGLRALGVVEWWSGGMVAVAIIIQRISLKRCSGGVESRAILPTRPQWARARVRPFLINLFSVLWPT